MRGSEYLRESVAEEERQGVQIGSGIHGSTERHGADAGERPTDKVRVGNSGSAGDGPTAVG